MRAIKTLLTSTSVQEMAEGPRGDWGLGTGIKQVFSYIIPPPLETNSKALCCLLTPSIVTALTDLHTFKCL